MLSAAVVLAVASPMTGSFLKCWADRARTGVSVADGRSFCDNCGKTLEARDLIPILSWIMAGGKSRCCHQTISPTLLLAEIASTLMAVSALVLLPQAIWLPALVLAWCLQALSLLTGASMRASYVLALFGTLIALAVPALSSLAPISLASAFVGGASGVILWLASTRILPSKANAALVLPMMGAMAGAPLGVLAIFIGFAVAFLHAKLRRHETLFETTSLAIGFATGAWVCWIGLFV